MKLLTKAIEKALPVLGSTSNLRPEQVKVVAKFFNPSGAGTWYATEYDPQERMFFGYAKIQEGELGYFSLDELQSLRGRFGLGIERDIHWNPETTLAQVMAKEGRR